MGVYYVKSFLFSGCVKRKKRMFEQDGYKTFGENCCVSCCKFMTSQALTFLLGGGGVRATSFGDIQKTALFEVLWHF